MRNVGASGGRSPKSQRREAVQSPPGAVSPWVQLRSGTAHPFIYQRMVRAADPAARPGDVVNIYDKSDKLFGRGLYNPSSMIVLRVLTYGDTQVDDAFWRTALSRAIDLRRRLRIDETTDAYRLVHAEGDGLSGLVVERYADCLVFEVFSLGMFQRCQMLAQHLAELLGPPPRMQLSPWSGQGPMPTPLSPPLLRGEATPLCPPLARAEETPLSPPLLKGEAVRSLAVAARIWEEAWRVVVRADEFIERTEGFRVAAVQQPEIGRLVIREHGIRYRVDAAGGHKTGFFCDQRDNRRRLATLCRDATVLDLCCYTGGFSLCAKLLGGAREVTGVDLDETAIALAKENANLNQTRIDFVQADAFAFLRLMIANGRRFDTVVLDPPKLATTRNDLEDALRKYNDLNALAMQVVRPDGILVTCSCSGLVSRPLFTETVFRAARRAGVALQIFDQTGAGPDHPVMMNCPESEYLKVLWLRIRKDA